MSEITYTMQKDYLIPDLTLPPQPEVPLGKFAHLRREFLEKHRRVTFVNLLTSCKLTEHLYQIEQEAISRFGRLTKQLAQEQGVTEELKARDQMTWIGRMNNIRQQAEEVILSELIYSCYEVTFVKRK